MTDFPFMEIDKKKIYKKEPLFFLKGEKIHKNAISQKKIGKTDAINCVANHFDFTVCCIYCVMELSEIIFLLLIHFVLFLFSFN